MPSLNKITTAPDLVEQVYRNLLNAICDGTLRPGERITQESIADQLEVSRQPVLQALRLLKANGFVLDAPSEAGNATKGRGVLVAPLDAGWLTRVYQVRGALDALAAQLACAGSYTFDAELIACGRKAARSKDITAMIEADIAFHASIYRAAANPLIEQSAQLHWGHIRRAMGAVLQSTQLRDTVWDEHEAIARAIAAHDAPGAHTLMQGHGERASLYMQTELRQFLKTAQLPTTELQTH